LDTFAIEEPRTLRFDLPARGGVMAALEFGPSDRPVDILFVHANGFNARTYRSILQPLAGDLRIVAIDQRGHGASTLPAQVEGRDDWYDLRDDLVAVVAALGGPPLVLAGHSMGGTSCLLAADAAPERVTRLVLFDPVIMAARRVVPADGGALAAGARRRRDRFESRDAVFQAYRGRGAFTTWSDVQLADYLAAGLRDRPDGEVELTCPPEWEATNYTSQGHDSWGALARARRPVHIVRAARGSTCNLDEDRLAVLADRGAVTVETIPDTTHFLPMERPDLVRQALREAVSA
jgi:pimeloyl-ACP methyl ester carboxylesterase